MAATRNETAWQLRQASRDDLDAIMLIENAVFTTDAWSSDTMRSDLGQSHCYYVVAFRPETPGYIEGYAGLFAPWGAEQADIQTIAVSESARRTGLGRTLMRQLITEARRRGAHYVFLEVRADNPAAQQLYLSLGFEQLGLRHGYYQPDNVDALVMRLRIQPLAPALAGQP